jgi:hypothetical protein
LNTRGLMRFSSAFLGALGLLGSFVPEELLQYMSIDPSGVPLWIIQLLGALYFAFAMMNWTARDSVMGGIYSRPVVIGNLAHFFMGTITLIKVAPAEGGAVWMWGLVLIYAAFAISFTSVMFRPPVNT